MPEGVNVDLPCRAVADDSLELRYYWIKDNAVIEYNRQIEWLEGENVLKISNIKVDDAGIYTCIAYTPEPKRSEDKASAIVNIKGLFDFSVHVLLMFSSQTSLVLQESICHHTRYFVNSNDPVVF